MQPNFIKVYQQNMLRSNKIYRCNNKICSEAIKYENVTTKYANATTKYTPKQQNMKM